jgi:hypothetical protein
MMHVYYRLRDLTAAILEVQKITPSAWTQEIVIILFFSISTDFAVFNANAG